MCDSAVRGVYRAVVITKLLMHLQRGGAMPPHQTNNVSNHSSAKGTGGSVSIAREIPLLSNSCWGSRWKTSGEWDTSMSSTCFSISSQTSSATDTVSALDSITLYLRQKLINEMLLLDNYSVTFIDIVHLFLLYLFHIVISHVLLDWN